MKGNIICGWSGGGRAEEGVLEFLSNKNNLTRFFFKRSAPDSDRIKYYWPNYGFIVSEQHFW